MKKTALITGIAGQDGSFLSEFLLEKGYEVKFLFTLWRFDRFNKSCGGQIREQIFYAIFVENIETHIKLNTIMNALKQLIQ